MLSLKKRLISETCEHQALKTPVHGTQEHHEWMGHFIEFKM